MCELLSLEEILREGVIPLEQQGGGELHEAARTGDTQVGERGLLTITGTASQLALAHVTEMYLCNTN